MRFLSTRPLFKGVFVFAALALLTATLWISRRSEASFVEPAVTSAHAKPAFDTQVRVHAAKRGNPWINLRDGFQPQSTYRNQSLAAQKPQGEPVGMAAADFDGDGFEDLVVAYGAGAGGSLALHRSNTEAFAPTREETKAAIAELKYPAPFLAEVQTFDSSVVPNFIGAGDFNHDRNKDIVVAARGGNSFQVLLGDGHGAFRATDPVVLPGSVTALLAADALQSDAGASIVVAINTGGLSEILVYADADGETLQSPLVHRLPGPATSMAAGILEQTTDLVVGAGNSIVVLRASSGGIAEQQRIDLSFAPTSVAIGNFVWDRENLVDIAALGSDGVHMITPGGSDRRPYSQFELNQIRQRRPLRWNDASRAKFDAFKQSLITRPRIASRWLDAQKFAVAGSSLTAGLSKVQLSNSMTDELLLVDRGGRKVHTLLGVSASKMRDLANAPKAGLADQTANDVALDVEGTPVAALAMKVNLSTRAGVVVLQQDQATPSISAPVPLATFGVTTTNDTTTCGAPCSLRGAVIQSNATAGPNQINLPSGTYTLTLGTYDNEFALGGYTPNTGDIDIAYNDLTIIASSGTPIVQAGTTTATNSTGSDGNGIDRVFDVMNPLAPTPFTPINVTISGITIQNGKAPEAHPPNPDGYFTAGGAIQFDGHDDVGNVSNKTLTITNCTLTHNWASGIGGGVFAQAGQVNINTSTFSSNITHHGNGGGIDYDGQAAATPNRGLAINGSTFSGNIARGIPQLPVVIPQGDGGGVWSAASTAVSGAFGGVVITNNSHFDNNQAGRNGGGIYIANGQAISMTGGTIGQAGLGNQAGANVDAGQTEVGDGGGLWSQARNVTTNAASTILLDGVTVRANTAIGGNGGGIKNHFGTMTIQNTSHIDGNAADLDGGGIYDSWTGNVADLPSSITMSGGTIGQTGVGNTAKRNGGGLAVDFPSTTADASNKSGTVALTNVTITANTANSDNASGGEGGGIYHNGNGGTFSIATTLNGVTVDNNVGNSGGGGGVGTGIRVNGSGSVGGGMSASNALQLNNGNSLSVNAGSFTSTSATFTLTGNLGISGGTFNGNGGTVNLTGNFTLSSGTYSGGANTVNIVGNFTFSGGTFTHGNGTFSFNSANPQSINGPSSPTFGNLTKTLAGTLTLGVNSPIALNLTLNGGTLDLATFTANRTAAGGTLTVANGTLLKIGGTNTLPSNFNTHAIGATSTIEYYGTNQNVAALNSSQNYGNLVTSVGGTKTLAGAIGFATSLTIGASTTLDVSASNFAISALGNWTNNGTFTPRSGTVTFGASGGTQTLTGNTGFFNLTLNNAGATTNFGSTTTTVGSNFVTSAGTMDGGTSTFIFTGNPGSYSGNQAKNFHNLTINAGANISNNSGTGNTNIANDYSNAGTFSQAATLTTTFLTGPVDGLHNVTGAGTSTFGIIVINNSNTVDGGSHTMNVIGTDFTSNGTFNGNAGTVGFTGNNNTQTAGGTGNRNFFNLTINHTGTGGVALGSDSSATGLLTLTSDLTATSGMLNQTGGTSAGAADVVGLVRRTDLGVIERSFGNVNNSITINSGTGPTQMDFNLVKSAPATFPVGPSVVPRDYTLTPSGGGAFSATLKLRYLDPGDLAGVTENQLVLWKYVGGTTWTPQGGTVDLANNFVSLSGVTSFSEWAIAEGTDLIISKANNVANAAKVGQQWTWTITVTNQGGADANFTTGQTIATDNLPNAANIAYGALVVSDPNISCSIVSNDLTCTANAAVTIAGGGNFTVQIPATASSTGVFQNPRAGGATTVDPNNVITEIDEGNNTAANNTVTVTAANTTTTITNGGALANPSVTGQPVTVQWSVTVNAPGALGDPLTGNVTVTDGTDSCFAPVANLQCDITFTSAGAKSINATYAGDGNYNTSTTAAGTPHTVNKADTTTTITSDNPDPSDSGQNVTVIYTVTANSPGGGTPTGNVVVTVSGGAETCNSTVAVGQCTLALTVQGARTITADYQGDLNYNISSDTEAHSVCQNNITVTSPNDSGAGTLRQALIDICDGGTIDFNLGVGPNTITLTGGELAVNKSVTIQNVISAGNGPLTISGGGASRVFNINSGTTVSIAGLTISAGLNVSSGGGIWVDHGTLTLTNVTVGGNTGGAGGGIYVDGGTSGSASLTVINSTISGNTSTVSGGGIYVNGLGGGAATLVITNSTVSGNNADLHGGGIAATAGTTSTLTNVTVTDNRADNDNNGSGGGGGIASFGTMTLKNTILAANFNEDGAVDSSDDANGSIFDPASTHNLLGNGDGSTGIFNGTNNNQVGTGASPINPQLGSLANNGGPTQTHRLQGNSPALNVGNNAYVTAPPFLNTVPITDQRGTGFPRIASTTVDMGAYELQPPTAMDDTYGNPPIEDTPFSVNAAAGVLANDTPAAGGALTASLVSGPANAQSFTLNPDGSFDYTPNPNFAGADQFIYTVTEANGGSANATVTLNVAPVNDTPSFSAGPNQTVIEDAGAQTVNPWATNISKGGGADENGQTVNFIVSNNNNALFSVQPAVDSAGVLTYTPAANAFGSATVDVQIHDNGGGLDTSAVQQFTITVTAVADTPSVTNTTTLEDTPSNTNLVITRNAADGAEVTHFKITNILNGQLFKHDGSTQINNGDFILVADAANVGGFGLVFKPSPDFNSNTGTGNFDIQASTSGSNAGLGGGVITATITVTPVNDTPSFTKGPDIGVNANSGAHSFPGWATNIMRGPATATDETGQTVNFIVSNNNPILFAVAPAIDSTGTLTFTVAAGQFGQATVDVQIHDNGGGADTSAVQQFIITVTSVDLTPTKSHVGPWKQGDTGKTYTISVKNIGQDASVGLVTLADSLPAGLIARSLSGSGWTCDPIPGGGTPGPATLNCTRSDALPGAVNATYPDITLTVDIACNAPANVTNSATVSGGNDASPGNNTSADATVINPDNIPPVIVCPGGISRFTDSGQNTANVNVGVAVATDNCGQVTVTGTRSDGKPLNAPFPVGITIITWTAKDAANNMATCAQSITVMVPSSPHKYPSPDEEEALLTLTDALMTVLTAVW